MSQWEVLKYPQRWEIDSNTHTASTPSRAPLVYVLLSSFALRGHNALRIVKQLWLLLPFPTVHKSCGIRNEAVICLTIERRSNLPMCCVSFADLRVGCWYYWNRSDRHWSFSRRWRIRLLHRVCLCHTNHYCKQNQHRSEPKSYLTSLSRQKKEDHKLQLSKVGLLLIIGVVIFATADQKD